MRGGRHVAGLPQEHEQLQAMLLAAACKLPGDPAGDNNAALPPGEATLSPRTAAASAQGQDFQIGAARCTTGGCDGGDVDDPGEGSDVGGPLFRQRLSALVGDTAGAVSGLQQRLARTRRHFSWMANYFAVDVAKVRRGVCEGGGGAGCGRWGRGWAVPRNTHTHSQTHAHVRAPAVTACVPVRPPCRR